MTAVTSTNRYAFHGEMLTIAEIAEATGLHPATVWRRLRDNVPLDLPDKRRLTDEERTALGAGRRFASPTFPRRVEYRHVVGSIRDWSLLTDVPAKILRSRLDRGWPVERALTTPA